MKSSDVQRKSKWRPLVERSAFLRYVFSTLLVLAAFGLRESLNFELGNQLPFTFFVTSSILAAWLGGLGTGLYALVLGILIGDYFFLPPVGAFAGYGKLELTTLISATAPSVLAITLIESLHRTRRRLQDRTRELERENQMRKEAEVALEQAQIELKDYALNLEGRVEERTGELEKSVKFLEGFCYTIAHDLRAPLRAMRGFVQALEEDYHLELDEKGRDYTGRVKKASDKMDKLVLDLLEYARLNHAPLTLAEVNLDEAVTTTLAARRDDIERMGVDMHVNRSLGSVWGDVSVITEILKRLIDNALQYKKPDRVLRIEIWSEMGVGWVKLWIKDNGIGIEPRFQERIFQMFERLDVTSETSTGAGLAIVAKGMERLGGSAGVQSTLGQGSAFWIEIPMSREGKKTMRRPETLKAPFPAEPISMPR